MAGLWLIHPQLNTLGQCSSNDPVDTANGGRSIRPPVGGTNLQQVSVEAIELGRRQLVGQEGDRWPGLSGCRCTPDRWPTVFGEKLGAACD